MLTIRRSHERGESRLDWLDSRHTFSFADYYDPQFMSFADLRVINEDIIKPGKGFGRHPHKNMEIITYVVSGSLEHKDSLGNGSIIRPGEIQRMSAGTGIEHSEFNHSHTEPLHLLQIWIVPVVQGMNPGYEQKQIHQVENQFILIGSPEPEESAVTILQKVRLYVAYLTPGSTLTYTLNDQHRGWIQCIKGVIDLNNLPLSAGDGAGIERISTITVTCVEQAELLFFDFMH